jgi:hypothetical protein
VQRMQFYNLDHLSSRKVSFRMSDIQHKHECTCWIALQVLMRPNNVWTLEQDHTERATWSPLKMDMSGESLAKL